MPDTPTKDDTQAQPTSPQACTNETQGNGEPANVTPVKLPLPESENETEEEQLSPATTARSLPTENADQKDEAFTVSEAIIKRRQKRVVKPFYYIGGNNGAQIIDEYLSSLGWERISDRNREDYKLKWCEIKSHNNYCTFREGEQLCYQIPNNKVLTTKIGLLTSLQEYDRVMNKVKNGKPRIMKYQEFFPETYRLDVKEDRDTFYELYKDGEIWISKPTGLNQGKGIYLIRSREDIAKFQVKMADIEEDVQTTRKLPFKMPMARIAQRYVTNPLLLDGKKFDVRNYMLIASTQPFVVFYRDGYCRLTCLPYDESSTDMTGHLTNQFMQKKNPLYQEVKDETVWSMDRFNEYVNEHHMEKQNLPQDWVQTVLRRRCQQIMLHCFQSVRHKLDCKVGFFDLYGCDFLVDDNFKIHLLEFNCNPALHTNCELLKEVIPDVVTESLKLAIEIFNKTKARERIMPLAAQEQAVLLYNGDLIEAEERREKLRTIAEARRRARSSQRRKKFLANFNLRGSFQGQRGSDGENEGSVVPSTSTVSVPTTASATPMAITSAQAQLITNRLYPKVPPSTEVTSSPPTSIPVSGSRSQTSMSTTFVTHTHSPTRVTGSRSMPNMMQKKPFYAGGSVASRPFSAPRFQRNRKSEPRQTSTMTSQQNKNPSPPSQQPAAANDAADEELVTEQSVVASLEAKLRVHKPVEPTVMKNTSKRKQEREGDGRRAAKKSPDSEKESKPKQQNRGRPRERIRYQPRNKTLEGDALILYGSPTEIESPTEADKNDKLLEANRILLKAMMSSSVATQAPAAKLPPNYHSKANIDTEFSKKYLAGISSKKGQNITGKINGMIRTFKAPLPSAVTLATRDANLRMPCANDQLFMHQQKQLQYRAPTSVRVRQTLQATTCTLEIGPKARRGLVAIPNPTQPSTTPVNQGSKMQVTASDSITRLRMMNVAASYPPSGAEGEDIALICSPTLKTQSVTNVHQFDKPKIRATCVDSSTQTPVSNYTLSQEEKVIWRLRTKVGATSNNTRMSNKHSVPSTEAVQKPYASSGFPLSGVRTYPGVMQKSSRYIAVQPTLGNGVTLVISSPPQVSGKNMLPTIREGRNSSGETTVVYSHDDSLLCSEHAVTPQLSQTCPTPVSDGEDEIPSGQTVRTILNDVAQAKLEDNSEKWMAPG